MAKRKNANAVQNARNKNINQSNEKLVKKNVEQVEQNVEKNVEQVAEIKNTKTVKVQSKCEVLDSETGMEIPITVKYVGENKMIHGKPVEIPIDVAKRLGVFNKEKKNKNVWLDSEKR